MRIMVISHITTGATHVNDYSYNNKLSHNTSIKATATTNNTTTTATITATNTTTTTTTDSNYKNDESNHYR